MGEQRLQGLAGDAEVEQAGHHRVIEGAARPQAEAAELGAEPVAAVGDVGPPIDRIPHLVPGHHVAHRIERAGEAALMQRRAVDRRRRERRGDGLGRKIPAVADRRGEAKARHLVELIAQHRHAACRAARSPVEIAFLAELLLEGRDRLVEADEQRPPFAADHDVPAARDGDQVAGRLVEPPVDRLAVRRRQLDAEQQPEAQAPFGELQGPPFAAHGEVLDLAIAPGDLAAGVRQGEIDGRAGEIVAQQPGAIAPGEAGEGRAARCIGAGRDRKPQRREGNLRRKLAVPAVPGAREGDLRFSHARNLMC